MGKRKTVCLTYGQLNWKDQCVALCGRELDDCEDALEHDGVVKRPPGVCRSCWPVFRKDMNQAQDVCHF